MPLRLILPRSPILMLALLLAGPAVAQSFQPAPSQGFGPPQQAAPQEPPCFKDFSALRDDAQNKAKALGAANKRKAAPQEACRLFNALIASEIKLVKFTEANGTWCGIPPQVLTQMKTEHARASEIRTRVCEFAARGPQAAPGPSLSDALGTTRVPDASNIKSGRGTFDTLTGTPLGAR
jgi:hypothetical protein